MAANQVRALLMGGQACVFYGAAEFSRDIDFAILTDEGNWQRLQKALSELQAECIPNPPCQIAYLRRGFALHFRCYHPEALKLRVDVMSVMRGVDDFEKLWERRLSLEGPDGAVYHLMALSDLVRAKKTQRNKDWPMIQRLIEADFLGNRLNPDSDRVLFWLREMRTPELLIQLAKTFPSELKTMIPVRPLLAWAEQENLPSITQALLEEEAEEREKDRRYWQPLKAELERLRHDK